MRHRPCDLVVFDIDGTLIAHPTGRIVWQELNQHYGTSPEVNAERLRRHLAGEISYPEWVDLDIGDWQRAGATRSDIAAALRDFDLVPGARETLATLQERGYRLAAVSGTVDILVDTVFADHPFAKIFANRVFFDDNGKISGWRPTPYDFNGKAVAMRQLAEEFGTDLSRMAFVGDDRNDVGAAQAAGLSIAFRYRSQALADVCDVVVPDGSMTQLLPHFP